jgi:hypothetical protein
VPECSNSTHDARTHLNFRCELAAWTVVRIGLPELAAVRQQPGLRFPPQVTPQFLKNSDDQTITTLMAVHETIRSMDRSPADFREWGVVSSSRYVGRGAFAATLHKYGNDGPWGVSVQIVPHNLLHSVSSTISLSLPCQGPCLGAGGGAQGEVDALLAAANLLADPSRPGVWVTWSSWDPELQIDARGKPTSESHCIATVLALQPIRDDHPRAQLEIRAAHGHAARSVAATESKSPLHTLASVLLDVNRLRPKAFDVVCQLQGGLELEMTWRTPVNEILEMPAHSSVQTGIRQPFVLARAG